MKKIYIADIRGHVVDKRIEGHIIPVAKNYKQVLNDNYDVIIAAGPVILNSFNRDDCLLLPYNISDVAFKDKIHTFINFLFLIWKAKGSPIILQQSTTITTFIAIIFLFWWTSPLYMIQYNTEAVNTWWKKIINRLAQMKISGTLCPTDRIGKAYGGRFCVVPDFFYTDPTKEFIPFNERKWDIGIIGGISTDKGVVDAARILANTEFNVLIAGRVSDKRLESSLNEIVSSCDNIDFRPFFPKSDEYYTYIKESKFCMLNYRGIYFDRSSGIVLDAIYNGTPVIGTKCEALKIISNNNLGVLYEKLDKECLEKELTNEHFELYLNNIKKFLDAQLKYQNKFLDFIK